MPLTCISQTKTINMNFISKIKNIKKQMEFSRVDPIGAIPCYSNKFLFICLSKNGVTSLKKLVAKLDDDEEPKDLAIHDHFGFKNDGEKRLRIQDINKESFDSFIKFAVYRDPVKRLVSLYSDKISPFRNKENIDRRYFESVDLLDAKFSSFFSFVKRELKKEPAFQDEHIRRQSSNYRPEDVDYIVPIKHLNGFMKDVVKIQMPRKENKSNPTEIPKRFVSKIKKLYQDDYKILDAPNVYTPNNDFA